MDNGAFGVYLLFFGFVLLLMGILVAASSVGMLSNYSTISNVSTRLLLGAVFGLAGIAFLLMGFLSSKRVLRQPY